jgi:hypothetical protein
LLATEKRKKNAHPSPEGSTTFGSDWNGRSRPFGLLVLVMASNHFGRSRTTVSFHHRLTALIEFRHYMAGPVTRRMLMMELIHLLSFLFFSMEKKTFSSFSSNGKFVRDTTTTTTTTKNVLAKKVAGPSPRAKHFLFVLEELSFCKTPLYLLLLLFYTSRVEKERTNFV